MAIECGKVLNHMVCRLYIEESGVNLGARERKWERGAGRGAHMLT